MINRDNQRPISILPCLSKIDERFANAQLQEFAIQNSLIRNKQFDFKEFSSWNVALIWLVDEWKRAIDEKRISVAAFLDLRKIFEVINHNHLLNKPNNADISGIPLKWLESYLKNRKQFVSCNGVAPNLMTIKYGVPKGTVSGPTLFSIHFDDITSVFERANCTLFADDTEIHSSNKDISCAANCVNEDLAHVADWVVNNAMVVHAGKSEVLKTASRPALRIADDIDIHLNNRKLKEFDSYKYLRVYVDNRLSRSNHFKYV